MCLTIACDSPAGPGPLQRPAGGQGPAGSTVKVTAPTAMSPRNDQVADSLTPTLRVSNSRGIFTPGLAVLLVYEVFDGQDSLLYRSEAVAQDPAGASHVVTLPLAPGLPYSWRAVPFVDGREGPPSARATFRTPGGPGSG